jgi:hypothetical protein
MGIRSSELLGLAVTDLDFEQNKMWHWCSARAAGAGLSHSETAPARHCAATCDYESKAAATTRHDHAALGRAAAQSPQVGGDADFWNPTRLRPMRGLTRLRSARVISTGHAFVQNLCRDHYELGMDTDQQHRLPTTFTELTRTI